MEISSIRHRLSPPLRCLSFPLSESASEGVEFFEAEQECDLAGVQVGGIEQMTCGVAAHLIQHVLVAGSRLTEPPLECARAEVQCTGDFSHPLRFAMHAASKYMANTVVQGEALVLFA